MFLVITSQVLVFFVRHFMIFGSGVRANAVSESCSAKFYKNYSENSGDGVFSFSRVTDLQPEIF